MARKILILFVLSLSLYGCGKEESASGALELRQVFIGSDEINLTGPVTEDIPVDRSISLTFSTALNVATATNAIRLLHDGQEVAMSLNLSTAATAVIFPNSTLVNNTTYDIEISDDLQGVNGQQFAGQTVTFKTSAGSLAIISIQVNDENVTSMPRITDVPLSVDMTINFTFPLDQSSLSNAITITGQDVPELEFTLSNESKTLNIATSVPLKDLTAYELTIDETLQGTGGEDFSLYSKLFYTTVDDDPKFPLISDEELLTKVQQQTFKYFYDFGHPASGMARERNTSGDIVTSGGSGFGIMALVVGMERGFITRAEGIARMEKIVSFLETSDRFHGAWSHWLNGSNGDVVPFSTKDDGGDLVETSFLVQGLITFRQYMNAGVAAEASLINRINVLWEGVEWDWYRKNNEEVLYWHWSPNFAWDMNFPLYGYFEEQITYVLAAASPTHTIPKDVYVKGYGKNGAIVKNNTYYGIKLPLESPAPLFWVQYSYLGLDPHFTDDFANYWEQNVNATRINQAYCIANPKNFVAYSDECWGLTASDNQSGYSAHSPSNDLGVITPTAALSSFPYTPDESMKALKFFYYNYGDRLWGEYGFYDAFNITQNWTADSYLAIDQGPIIVMIENHRTGLLWDLFMSAPEVQNAVDKLDFTY